MSLDLDSIHSLIRGAAGSSKPACVTQYVSAACASDTCLHLFWRHVCQNFEFGCPGRGLLTHLGRSVVTLGLLFVSFECVEMSSHVFPYFEDFGNPQGLREPRLV